MTRVNGEAALVLHARPYRETSAIVSLLTAGHGRVSVVARGVRGGRRGNVLQPFNRVRVGWSGRGSLATLTGAELTRHAWLAGNPLAAGFYVLELISRLLVEQESMLRVFEGACWTLERLERPDESMDVVLRNFERLLLEELGYGLDFERDAESGAELIPGEHYQLHPQFGFVIDRGGRGYLGEVVLSIGSADYTERQVRVAAKKIFRQALRPLLGPRPLASRRLLTRQRA